MTMRILVTGGAGCLGSNLIERYHPQGCDICVIDNFATGKRELLPKRDRLRVIEGTIADFQLVKDAFSEFKPTHVIHSAASYKNPADWLEDVSTNVTGTINIAKNALEFGVSRIVNFQTALCYGNPLSTPIGIDHPVAPFTSYGISKTAGELYFSHSGLPVVSLRLANICGPRLAIGPIPTFYKRLKAGQKCFCSDTVRDFLDIHDFFRLMDIVMDESSPTGIFNVSSGSGYSIHEVFCEVAAYLGIQVPEVPILPPGEDDVREVVLDPSFTEQTFGWRAEVPFSQTIHNQLEWYDRHGISDIFSHLAEPSK